jgi:hypothetical protein
VDGSHGLLKNAGTFAVIAPRSRVRGSSWKTEKSSANDRCYNPTLGNAVRGGDPCSCSQEESAPSGAAQAMISELQITSFTIPQEETPRPSQRILKFRRQQ